MVFYEKNKLYTKRTAVITDVTDKVQRWDMDNLYPQRANEVAKRAYTLKSVLECFADFVNGEGFQDDTIAKLTLNPKTLRGQSANDVLNAITYDYARYRSFALHIGYNLNYTISSITPIPFEYCRLGIMDNETGNVPYIMYSPNWERDGRKTTVLKEPVQYHTFNSDKLVVAAQIAEAGIVPYRGQILYFTPLEKTYPLATFDPVMDHAQVQAELGLFKLSSVDNKFLADLAIVYPGEFETPDERKDFQELIENRSGARNAGKRIGLQDKSGTKKASDIFQVLDAANNDTIYEFTEKSVVNAITENYGIPKGLVGIRPETGLFNQEDIENEYTYYNARTRNDRAIIARVFSFLLEKWWQPIFNECNIKPQQYIADNTSGGYGVDINDNLKNMTGKQQMQLLRIVKQYGQEKLTYELAKIQLQGGFGLSEEEIDKILLEVDAQPLPTPGAPAPSTPPINPPTQ